MCTLWFALAVMLVSFVHTTQSQCTTTRCTESNNESGSENSAAYIHSLVDGVADLLQKADKTQANQEALEAFFNKRLSAIETKLSSQIDDVSAVCQSSAVTFLRRQDGSVNFTRTWSEYRDGFGDPDGEFWLGLTSVHRLTSKRRYRLVVHLLDWSGETKWAEYEHFGVGSESEEFSLSISGYNLLSTAGDDMTGSHSYNGMQFSTYDRDNDAGSANCAAQWKGGWWYRSCQNANPTGLYKPAGYIGGEGIRWLHAYNDDRSFKAVTLKLVPA